MSDISMIGLGAMGTALAMAQVKAGHKVTVWNRSPQRMTPLIELGAKGAQSVAAAVQASPVIMVCIDNYTATNVLLRVDDVAAHLSGRSVIQLSTGTPKEASDSDRWFQNRSAAYLDGAILVYPGTIGTAEAQILAAGPESVFEDCQPLLQCLAGDLRYLGPNVRAPAALDLAFLSRLLGIVFGSIHGVLLCESEGVSLTQFASLLPPNDRAATLAQVINDASFEVVGKGAATVGVAAGVVARMQDQANDAGINSELPDLIMTWLKRAKAAGYEGQDTAAVIKILRGAGEA